MGSPLPTSEPHGASISRCVQLCFNGIIQQVYCADEQGGGEEGRQMRRGGQREAKGDGKQEGARNAWILHGY